MRTIHRSLAFTAVLLAAAAFVAGCRRPVASTGDGATPASEDVFWRDELFDYAIDTMLNRLEEFDSDEVRQQTINRLDQWVHKQKPLENWQPDPMIAGMSAEASAAGQQMLELAEQIAIVQRSDPSEDPAPLDDFPAMFRSLGERLGALAARFSLIDLAETAEQSIALADQLDAIAAGNAGSPQPAAAAIRGMIARIPAPELGRMGLQLTAFGAAIDPNLLRFPVSDSLAMQEAVWLRNVASWASGEELDDPVKPVISLFDWVVKNIQLERNVPALAEGSTLLIKKPWETLLLGRGTAIERAWVFILLARQQNLDAVLLGLPGDREGESLVSRLWAVGVLIEGEIYLFDPSLGLPIVKPGSWELTERGLTGQPATLSEAAADDEVLRQMDAVQEGDYPVHKEDLQRVVALLEASPIYLSQRMKMVEARLTGDEKIVLTSDPTAQAERFQQSPYVVDAVLWRLPYQALWQEVRHTQDRFLWQQATVFSPGFRNMLWKARAYHFKGVFTGEPSAAQFYQMARQSDFALAAAGLDDETVLLFRDAKIDASYWLGLLVGQTGNQAAAEDYLRTRVLAANPGGKWEQGAAYNLARIYEATDRIPEAIRIYRSGLNAPGLNGNLVRARWLSKLAGLKEEMLLPRQEGEKSSAAATEGEPAVAEQAEQAESENASGEPDDRSEAGSEPQGPAAPDSESPEEVTEQPQEVPPAADQ